MQWVDGANVDNPRPAWFPKLEAEDSHIHMRLEPDEDRVNDKDGSTEYPYICELK